MISSKITYCHYLISKFGESVSIIGRGRRGFTASGRVYAGLVSWIAFFFDSDGRVAIDEIRWRRQETRLFDGRRGRFADTMRADLHFRFGGCSRIGLARGRCWLCGGSVLWFFVIHLLYLCGSANSGTTRRFRHILQGYISCRLARNCL